MPQLRPRPAARLRPARDLVVLCLVARALAPQLPVQVLRAQVLRLPVRVPVRLGPIMLHHRPYPVLLPPVVRVRALRLLARVLAQPALITSHRTRYLVVTVTVAVVTRALVAHNAATPTGKLPEAGRRPVSHVPATTRSHPPKACPAPAVRVQVAALVRVVRAPVIILLHPLKACLAPAKVPARITVAAKLVLVGLAQAVHAPALVVLGEQAVPTRA
jgi:hypothetical protein